MTGSNQVNQHAQIMNALKEKHDVIKQLIGERSVVFIDVPVYDNLGDLLILHGTLAFFQKHKIKVSAKFSAININEKTINSENVIVFQGGGNFGDLYYLHQNCREEIIRKFPKNRIIILPQSIHFESAENLKNTSRLFNQHSDLHLCVRDRESQALAEKMSKHVYLLPDMAHQLYPLTHNTTITPQTNATLFINRTDKETKSKTAPCSVDKEIDWYELVEPLRSNIEFHRRYQYRTRRFGLRWLNQMFFLPYWIKFSYHLTDKAITLFTSYDLIVTNRLHGHILACLMNKNNHVLDNSYAKNSRYVLLWTFQSELVKLTKE